MDNKYIYSEDGKKIIYIGEKTVTSYTAPYDLRAGGFFESSAFKSPSTVYIPKGTAAIDPHAFEGSRKLKHVFIPNSVRQMGAGAFRKCTDLVSVQIGKGLTLLEKSMFYGCSSLTSLDVSGRLSK